MDLAFGRRLHEVVIGNVRAFDRQAIVGEGLRRAGVALTIAGDADGRACFVLTRRATTLRRHAGQWALPGGKIDDGETAENAALRELREELGLSLPGDAVCGLLDDYETRSGFVITPVVVWAHAEPSLTIDPNEVESAFLVPLEELAKPDVPRLIDGVDPGRPIIQVPLYGHFVHAPTAAMVYQFREVALRGRDTRVAHYDQPAFAWK